MSRKQVIENVQPLRTKEEITNMREALSQTNYRERNLLLFNIGINTGLRISDILALRVEDVKGKTSIVIKEGKTKKKRTVHLNAVLVELTDYINEVLDGADEGFLFPSRKGDKAISRVQAHRILSGAGKACGYDYIGTHTLRKTFGYHFYQRTKDVATLMTIFNHSDQQTTKRYIGISDDEIKASLSDFCL